MDQYPSLDSQERVSISSVRNAENDTRGIKGRLRIVVDLNCCQSYAQCCFLAPDVFRLSGEEALIYYSEPDASRYEEVMRAAAACPVQAITVETCDRRRDERKERA